MSEINAIRFAEPWQVSCVKIPMPEPKPGEALIKIMAAGICGSDIGAFRGTNGLVSYPRVIGHELAGVVVSIPENNKNGIKVGDRVVVDPYLYCGHCYPCSIGRTNCCDDLHVLGVHVEGGMAEYFCHPADMLVKIPDGMSWVQAAMAEPLTISLHGSEDAFARLRTLLPESRFAVEGRAAARPYTEPLTPPVNEAFVIDGGVNYDVLVWPMERRSDRKVLARVMSYEYLWHNIREVGGAYGTGMLSSDGVEYLYTYRDPHVKESYDAFAKGPAELAAREYTEKDLNDFIVGTVAKLDTPRKPRAEARETDRRYFCGITDEMMAADRKALCAVDAALLKEQAAELGAAMANGVRVVFGSKDAVEAAKELFDTVETL